ncbi:MAG: hypothetical protein HUJ54_08900 [Erysipelotrichaceae bacterium]|nr:hypothetical protein [Erysipelotrichaceae bacterium]
MPQLYKSGWDFLKKLFHSFTSQTTLKDIADRYENEIMPYEYVYTFKKKGAKPQTAAVRFEKGNFCHLFSIGSMVKGLTPDLDQFSGKKGWDNIQSGKITYDILKRANPNDFNFYHREQLMMDQLIQTLDNPKAVAYDKSVVKNSNLEADVILFEIFGNFVIHLCLGKDRDGRWFPRSYFVREVSKDLEFPTKYIANQTEMEVKLKKRRISR